MCLCHHVERISSLRPKIDTSQRRGDGWNENMNDFSAAGISSQSPSPMLSTDILTTDHSSLSSVLAVQELESGEGSDLTPSTLHGRPCALSSQNVFTCLLVRPFAAIASMDEELKVECLQARRMDPQLVEEESNPMRFLRTDRVNPWSASKRITLY